MSSTDDSCRVGQRKIPSKWGWTLATLLRASVVVEPTMTKGRIVTAFGLFVALLVATPALVEAQGRGGGGGGGRVPPAGGGSGRVPSGPTGRAVPRQGPPPRPNGPYGGGGGYGYGYRPYYSPYYYRPYYSPYYYGAFAPGFSVGLAFGFGYGSVGFGYSGYYGPYGYGAYGYPYGYGYGGYPYGNVYAAPYAGYGYGQPYGGIRIDLPQRDAEVWADGYFAGTVDNFDGSMQQLSLTPGPHRVEVRQNGFEPVSFEVNVEPGRTVTYKTMLRPAP